MSHDTSVRHARLDFVAAPWRTADEIEAALVKHGFQVRSRDEDVLTGDPSFVVTTIGHGLQSRLNAVMALVGLVRVTELDASGQRPRVVVLVKPAKEGGTLRLGPLGGSFCAYLRDAGFEVVSCAENPGAAHAQVRGLRDVDHWRELLTSAAKSIQGRWEVMD